MKKQIECPHCQSFKTATVSPKKLARIIGLTSVVVGMATLIFVVGFVFLFIGIVALILSLFLPDNGKMRCRECGFIFTV